AGEPAAAAAVVAATGLARAALDRIAAVRLGVAGGAAGARDRRALPLGGRRALLAAAAARALAAAPVHARPRLAVAAGHARAAGILGHRHAPVGHARLAAVAGAARHLTDALGVAGERHERVAVAARRLARVAGGLAPA